VSKEDMIEIIAEIGQNHNGDIGLAKELIHAARECGANVAKFQLFDARELFPREGNPWFEYNCKCELDREQTLLLAEDCARLGIEFMASVFDCGRIGWLEEAGVARYKVASRSVVDKQLIEAIAATGKPILVSLGMWQGSGFPAISAAGGVQFLYCVSKYPTALDEVELSRVDFSRYAGFSDHTVGVSAPLAAMSRGARIIEKHFTLDKAMFGPDHEGSATPDELKQMTAFRDDCEMLL